MAQGEHKSGGAPLGCPHTMPLRRTTLRWDERAHAQITAAAEACGGVTFAQFVRESALMRATIVLARPGLDPYREARLVREVSDEVRRLSAIDDT